MKQALLKKGIVYPTEVPEPETKKGFVKIKVLYSCISAGTELVGVKDSRKSLITKIIDNPQKITDALKYFQEKGLKSTKAKIASVEESLKSIGYSISGKVIEVGGDVKEFKVNDLVAGGGHGFAVHAEYVTIPKNLVVKIPEKLEPLYASIGTVGSIALHGVRRAKLNIGEFGVVFGVGLLGLLALQILKSAGIRVACIDLDYKRLAIAKELGAELVVNAKDEDPVLSINNWTNGYGSDAVLFTAATDSDEPLSQSFKMCRKKGRVVLVGVSGMNINRKDIYKNEIDFIISASYGPGRYDDNYELEGNDYPYAFVRWTENRNISEFLRLIRDGLIDIDRLKPQIHTIDDAAKAYEDLEKNNNSILTILEYNSKEENGENDDRIRKIAINTPTVSKNKINIGLIGGGGFSTSTLLPIINELSDKFYLKTVVNRNGERAYNVAKQFNAEIASSSVEDIYNDKEIDLIVVCTRHDNHAKLVMEALKRGKHIFVEKPLATNIPQLTEIKNFYNKDKDIEKPMLMVGFNRRFSSYAKEVKHHVINRINPLFMHYRMNAGFIPYDSWVHNDGGRIVGEACHIIDMMLYLTDSTIKEISVSSLEPATKKFYSTDNKSMTFKFEDGSMGILDYFSVGSKSFAKEFLEVHFDQKTIIIDDFKTVRGYGIKVKNLEAKIADKGHKDEWVAVYDALKTGQWPIDIDTLMHTTDVSIIADKS